MTPAKIGLVLDCGDPQTLATFWSQALGYVIVGGVENYVLLVDEEGVQPKLLLQKVPEDKQEKNRMHIDFDTPDVDGEVKRLEGLGARRLEDQRRHEHGTSWVIMSDPEGNEFCVCQGVG